MENGVRSLDFFTKLRTPRRPKASSERLMFVASWNRMPSEPDFFTRSEPARSTTFSLLQAGPKFEHLKMMRLHIRLEQNHL